MMLWFDRPDDFASVLWLEAGSTQETPILGPYFGSMMQPFEIRFVGGDQPNLLIRKPAQGPDPSFQLFQHQNLA